jgi:hypothetical protein
MRKHLRKDLAFVDWVYTRETERARAQAMFEQLPEDQKRAFREQQTRLIDASGMEIGAA